MKNALIAALALSSALVLSACGGTWEAEATCKSDGGCSVTGRVKGTFKAPGDKDKDKKKTLLQLLAESQSTFDAAQFSIDTSGSNVGVPSNGLVTIYLIDAEANSVQASRVFSWVRSGTDLILSDPNAVNEWALAEGGTANSLEYAVHEFAVSQNTGSNTLVATTQYEGATYASSTTSWNVGNGGCREVRCHQQ